MFGWDYLEEKLTESNNENKSERVEIMILKNNCPRRSDVIKNKKLIWNTYIGNQQTFIF